jgi:ER membrane protein complex subunit 7
MKKASASSLLRACLFLLCATSVDAAISGTATIEGKLQFVDKSVFNATTRITLNHGEFSTYSRAADGGFTIYNVPPGVHVLDVQSTAYHFSQIKIQLLEDDMQNPKCLEYVYPGAKKQPTKHPLVLNAIATYDYFETRKSFSILSILGNPMLLMMALSAGMMFVLPKMMEGMEPEEKEQMKKQMEMQKDPTKMLGQLWGDITGTSEDVAKTKAVGKIKK